VDDQPKLLQAFSTLTVLATAVLHIASIIEVDYGRWRPSNLSQIKILAN